MKSLFAATVLSLGLTLPPARVITRPMGAPPEVVEDVDAMIGSPGPVPGAQQPGAF